MKKQIPMPPMLDGETLEAYTDRLTGADGGGGAYQEKRSRSCCIGYHDECSDPKGEWCECPCHKQEYVMENQASLVHGKIIDAIEAAREFKGDDRSAKSRYTAIAITQLETALAVFVTFVVNDPQPPSYPQGGLRKG